MSEQELLDAALKTAEQVNHIYKVLDKLVDDIIEIKAALAKMNGVPQK
jgi:hypothetical protein